MDNIWWTLYLSHSFMSKDFGYRGKRPANFTPHAQIQLANPLQSTIRKLVENVSLHEYFLPFIILCRPIFLVFFSHLFISFSFFCPFGSFPSFQLSFLSLFFFLSFLSFLSFQLSFHFLFLFFFLSFLPFQLSFLFLSLFFFSFFGFSFTLRPSSHVFKKFPLRGFMSVIHKAFMTDA